MSLVDAGWEKRCHRLLRSARILLDDGDFASAVSRSYYAMFFAAEALLASQGLSFSSHHAVIGAFGKEFAKSGILPGSLHRALLDAAEARISSDYEMRPPITTQIAIHHIEAAEQFIAAAEKYLRTVD